MEAYETDSSSPGLEDLESLDLESESLDLDAGEHVHLIPEDITAFYNTCHGGDGKFCPTPGSGVGGKKAGSTGDRGVGKAGKAVSSKALPDKDGDGSAPKGSVKRGRLGESLADPHDGTRAIDGIRGYDAKGKPVPGTDAWLEAHGMSREVFNSRPYVKFESSKNDPAILEAFAGDPRNQQFWAARANQEGQHGGYIMYKHNVPGSPYGAIPPQVRPNKDIVTNAAKQAQAKTTVANDKARLELLKKTTPATLTRERRVQVKQTELHLERIKAATPAKIRAEATKNLDAAKAALTKAKAGGNPDTIKTAQKGVISAKRQYDKDNRRANNWNPEKELHDATTSVTYAKARLENSIKDPKSALTNEIKSQERRVDRSENRLKKTAAKYVFPLGANSARIDMNPDPQNVKNLTQGKGRIYFAMEGSIKNDAILTAIKKEDPHAAVVNVPSVTLWQEKGGAAGEVKWFTQKYGKGREIVLIPDADGIINPNVMAQAKGLGSALKNFGAGSVILAAPPTKKGTRKVIDHFDLPSGIDEGRKGVDDHLGGGRGTLGQLQYTTNTKFPSYDLSEYAGRGKGKGPKMNANAQGNTESALRAISGIVGPEGSSRITKKMLAQAAGLPPTSAKEARDRLHGLGIIEVEHIWDEQALSRGVRIRNPKVTDARVNDLVKKGVIKEPRLDQPFTEVTIDEAPVITIRDTRFRIRSEDVSTGSLSELSTWKQPASYKGWTSPVDGRPDSTGIAQRVADASSTNAARNRVRKPPVKITEAPPGRRLVRTKAGAKLYGVPIGSPIPIAIAASLTSTAMRPESGTLDPDSLNLVTSFTEGGVPVEEFYNSCHDSGGKFCPTPGSKGSGSKGSGSKGPGKQGKFVDVPVQILLHEGEKGFRLVRGAKVATDSKKGWPARGGRPVTTIKKAGVKPTVIDGIKVRAVYEVTASNGSKIRLYDKTGRAGRFKDTLLQNHARMHEMYPLNPPRNIVVSKPSFLTKKREIPANAYAVVYSGLNPTFVNINLLGKNVRWQGAHFMPSAKSGDPRNHDYLLTHEYGHQVDFAKNYSEKTGKYKENVLLSDPAVRTALSRYGKTDPAEGVAEAFAEWHHSNGTTTNPAAVSIARHEGWYGSSIRASGDLHFIDSMPEEEYPFEEQLSLLSFNLLSFEQGEMFAEDSDQDNGDDGDQDSEDDGDINSDIPSLEDIGGIAVIDVADGKSTSTILGNYEVEKPSEAEVAKGTKLVKEVFTELGLDYDKYAKGEVD